MHLDTDIISQLYNEDGNLVKREFSYGFIEEWEYDKNRNLLEEKNSNGHWKRYQYDKNGNKTKHETSDCFSETYKYDKFEKIIEESKNMGCSKYEYDELGNLMNEKYYFKKKHHWWTKTIGYKAVKAGSYVVGEECSCLNVTKTNKDGEFSFCRDFYELGFGNYRNFFDEGVNILKIQIFSNCYKKNIYDFHGGCDSTTDNFKVLEIIPKEDYEKYSKHISGRVVKKVPLNTCTGKDIYDENGRLILREYIYDYTLTYKYDVCGRLIEENNSDGFFEKFEYDNNGNLIKIEDNFDRFSEEREYDKNNKIISRKGKGYFEEYSYFKNGVFKYFSYYENGKLKRTEDSEGNIKEF